MKPYYVNEIFCSPQGEGVRAGTMNVFVRFAGCNMECTVEPGPKSPGGFDCDTEFAGSMKMTQAELSQRVSEIGGKVKCIIFTGGEPGLQLDRDLVQHFKDLGYYTCVETNGTVNLDGVPLDWITLSPKVAEHALRQLRCDEVKYVRGYMQALPRPRAMTLYHLLSPAFLGSDPDPKAVEWCVQLCKENPPWRLTVQYHKLIRAR